MNNREKSVSGLANGDGISRNLLSVEVGLKNVN